ncbi:rcc01693 family protein [Pseudotabrizicola sp. 4114]|uniref:rcc01693 family protein n=1 Tax=Pseudotabrizicola sp. 4114 TaxID=2817731 RepID=UPI00286105DD|nr:putative phage protein (TIGR02216 family) [Pseudorhodobacter sp. 4114]
MSGIDWPGLIRVGLHQLGLEPGAFWRLTPVELRIMLGADAASPPLTRARLAELAAAFPDTSKDMEHGADRRAAGTGGST